MKYIVFALLSLISAVALASSIGEHELSFPEDQQLQDRYERLTQELRCPKCQNNNVADSDAPIARDFRVKIHQLLSEGKTDDEVVEFFVSRYGEFVDYAPNKLWIWVLPASLLVLAIFVAYLVRQSMAKAKNRPLSQQEQDKLAEILKGHE